MCGLQEQATNAGGRAPRRRLSMQNDSRSCALVRYLKPCEPQSQTRPAHGSYPRRFCHLSFFTRWSIARVYDLQLLVANT
jgi:hypothetical protein